MEACASAHYWAREISACGHDVRLLPPQYVKRFVKRDKTADAEAIAEAVTRKTMRFVPVKTAEQRAAVMVLKTRALLVRQSGCRVPFRAAQKGAIGSPYVAARHQFCGLPCASADSGRLTVRKMLPPSGRFSAPNS